jgi:hypothetical protein
MKDHGVFFKRSSMETLKIRLTSNHWYPPPNSLGAFNTGGCFLNDDKSKRQVIFAYLHYGGLNESQ